LKLSEDPSISKEDQSRLERSQVYLGYKLFWVIRLYLNGRKFPQGLIKEKKWRAYVHDIMQFLSNPEILGELASLDAEILFQVISVLFLRTSKPFSHVLQGRDDFSSAGPTDFAARFQPHLDFLKDMDTCFLGADSNVSVPARQQYLFFIANIIIKDRELSNLSAAFFFRVTKELMRHYKGYLDFNKDLQDLKKK
jgi:flagellar biosynthesis regulator FlbT